MLLTDIKTAWRNTIKHRSTSIINISGLALGMAASVLIMLWVQNEMNFDNYHPHADRIYHVNIGFGGDGRRFAGTPAILADKLRSQVPGIEKVASVIGNNQSAKQVFHIGEAAFIEKKLAFVDAEWFSMFHYDFIEGNLASFNAGPGGIILTATLAKKYFGNKSAIGQMIRIDSVNYQVRAVVKDNRTNSSFHYTAFLPLAPYLKTNAQDASWMSLYASSYILIKKEADFHIIQKNITSLLAHEEGLETFRSMEPKNKNALTAMLTALPNMHFDPSELASDKTVGGKKTVFIFSLLGFLLLAIACINYVNLSTAKASKRSKEISVKKIMGAGSKTLFFQFMTESFVTSLLALVFTLVLVKLSLPWFNHITEKTFEFPLLSLSLWKVMAGTLLITILLTGIYPALLLSSFRPLDVLRGFNMLRVKNTTLRKILVTAQFAIAISLTICTLVILRQLYFIQNSNEGYDRKQIFSFYIPGTWADGWLSSNKGEQIKLIKNELLKTPAIEHVTVSNDDIQHIRMSMDGGVDWENRKKGQDPNISLLSVDADYKNIFNLELVAGRWFSPALPTDKHNYVLTETTVSTLGLKKPYIGQYFSYMNDTGQIIGVVKDFHYESFHEKIRSVVLLSREDLTGAIFIEAKPENMKMALAKAESTFKKWFPEKPFEAYFMDQDFEKMYRSDNKTATLVTTFSGIALFISCLGLFGLVSFFSEQKTKEIGIRKILGASVAQIAALLSGSFIKLIILAILVASPLAWWAMHNWLESFVYRINLSWWMFATASIAVIVIALISISVEVIKSAVANPVNSLRTE